jgi:ATPase subunit of ABC transporter with duplicated ATPase domains
MIRLESIGKQNGKQIVFIEASAALQAGEKIGLVGPNGAGKTTLFRMITGEERPTRARSPPIAASPSAISARMSATWPGGAWWPR